MDETDTFIPRNKFFLMAALGAEVSRRTAASAERIARSLDRVDQRLESQEPTKDHVSALYAAAIDTTGDVVERTYAGRWLCNAGYTSLRAIAQPRSRNREKRRLQFVGEMRRAAGHCANGLPTLMTDAEIGRFFDLAPAVLASVEESQAERGVSLPHPAERDADDRQALEKKRIAALREEAELLKGQAYQAPAAVDTAAQSVAEPKGDVPERKK